MRNNETYQLRTQAEVAAILTERGEPITRGGVCVAERKAIKKLREGLAEIAAKFGHNIEGVDVCSQ